MSQKFYKIRDKNTGLFSTGGRHPSWTERGKVWNSTGTVRQHLQMHDEDEERYNRYGYEPGSYYTRTGGRVPGENIGIRDNWEVVEYEFNPEEVNSFDAREFYRGE